MADGSADLLYQVDGSGTYVREDDDMMKEYWCEVDHGRGIGRKKM